MRASLPRSPSRERPRDRPHPRIPLRQSEHLARLSLAADVIVALAQWPARFAIFGQSLITVSATMHVRYGIDAV